MNATLENLIIRTAREDDLPALAAIFAADEIGGHGDTADESAQPDYLAAFRAIEASPSETLYVAELDGEVVGTFQTAILTKLVGRGARSMVIEAVQTRADMRGRGIGAVMINYCLDEARCQGLKAAQLTSNMARLDAHRFYERLGFEKRHLGFRMKLK
ncbi:MULTISPECIES: GNAT family N-acetyltransferase [Rhizobium/Agrobacterium group]|jgi:GNAT superfamily N-acetyltransferase|uniref:GNAT family N-acetyltransferase n=1 Tax=Rhizobium/Agrobacterium group TaxID=227290 RepID=UPI0005EF53C7|nr:MULTISPECIES: GNAT family N-acetyltransferase [Rhizobium/Agrobacterium group]MDP9733047.1 GNAT superfamily N-acetyltransferase [Rhizobium sp. SORGH_AS_0285]MDP9755123.1 GNAT superfamily N-acetyltransferase [Rhizobium sp. SORGH_AS_0260]MDR6082221.1 GNAT superfamily N-acetyltransferase [Agrobacterium sp. SORGH_AS_0440]PTV75700.1 N-acetyltransferase [Agrobacterium pusense]QSZ56548.1 GNAT family N-acetyltransferase [Rhizobium sp. ZX09]